MRTFASVLLCLFCTAGFAQSSPFEPGVYIRNAQDSNKWDKLYLASTAGAKTAGVTKNSLSLGIAHKRFELTYRDAEAPVRTSCPKPVFRIVGLSQTAPRDIVVVRLEQKKDHRELQVGGTSDWSGTSFGYPPDATTSVEVQEDATGMTLTPKADLKPGEYMLFASTPTALPIGYGGYDFSVK